MFLYFIYYILYVVYDMLFNCSIYYHQNFIVCSRVGCRQPPHGMVHVPYSQDGLDGLIAIGCHFYNIDSRHKVCQSVCEECIATSLVAELVAGTCGLLKR